MLAFRFTDLACLSKIIMQWCFHQQIHQRQDFFLILLIPAYWSLFSDIDIMTRFVKMLFLKYWQALWLKSLWAIYSALTELRIFSGKISRSLTCNCGKVPLRICSDEIFQGLYRNEVHCWFICIKFYCQSVFSSPQLLEKSSLLKHKCPVT